MNRKIEILSPAGDIETLKTGVNAGADAIYIGGSMFSARASAQNFDDEQMIEAIDYAHARDVRVYVAVNTLIKDIEIRSCLDYISFLHKVGADAIIVQDLGLTRLIREFIPNIPLHLSTQSAVSTVDDIKALSSLNVQRLVLPRETTVKEISEFSKNTDLELEVFVHGALCVSYSGRCLFSALNGGRSGNRGQCTQACRKKYDLEVDGKIINGKENMYVLSPKDLNTSNEIDKIIDSGAYSLKIEGRMKRKEYIHVCVKSYKAVTEEYIKYGKISSQTLNEVNNDLEKVFNRSFTRGYVLGDKGKNIINTAYQKPLGEKIAKVLNFDAKNKRLKIKLTADIQKGDGLSIGENVGRIIHQDRSISDTAKKGEIISLDFIRAIPENTIIYRTYDSKFENLLETEQKILKKLPLNVKLELKIGEKPKMTLTQEKNEIAKIKSPADELKQSFNIECDVDFIIEKSQKMALSDENIIKQISKTDTYPFEIADIQIQRDEDIFIPVKILNELRRKALESLYSEKISAYKKNSIDKISDDFFAKIADKNEDENNDISFFVDIQDEKHLADMMKVPNVKKIISSDVNLYRKIFELSPEKAVFKLPSIIRQEDSNYIEKLIRTLDNPKVLSSSYSFLDYEGFEIANYHLNCYNSFTHNFYNEKNIYTVASLENIFANNDDYLYLKDKSKVVIPMYIYPDLMLMEYCPHKDEKGRCRYNYNCKLPSTSITNEQNYRFLFEKFLDCKVAILSDKAYTLSKKQVQNFIDNGYRTFLIELKGEATRDISKIFEL